MNADMSFHRQRSNTAHNLEKLKKARASKIRSVKVEDKEIVPMNEEEKEAFFSVKAPISIPGASANPQSKLAQALMLSPKQSQNKFIEYARFDGSSQSGLPTRTMHIFLTMLPENQRNYPMAVCVSMYAKVQDFIGLICYKCTMANPDVVLKSVRHYGLYITEEDGEVEPDFPPLDVREPCSKFRFSHLALVERKVPNFATLTTPTPAPTMNQNFDYPRTLSMTSEMESVRHQALICDEKTRRMNLQQQQTRDLATMLSHTTAMEAPLYRSFRVHMIVMTFYKVEIQLGVSGEKIEIDPVQQNNKFWSSKRPQKAVAHKITNIAAADFIDVKSTRAVFRIIYMPDKGTPGLGSNFESSNIGSASTSLSGGGSSGRKNQSAPASPTFKNYSFETDLKTAQEVVEKITNILEMRSSVTRKEFLAYQEKKTKRRNRPKTNT